jgi:hypothetical protein
MGHPGRLDYPTCHDLFEEAAGYLDFGELRHGRSPQEGPVTVQLPMQIVPRPFGQVLGNAINSLGRTWRALGSTALMVFIPVGVLTILIFQRTGAADFLELVFNDPAALSTLPPDVFLEVSQPFMQAVAIAVALQTIAALFVYLTAHHVVASEIAGNQVSGPAARRHALSRMGIGVIAALLGLVVVGVLIGIGLAVWLVPFAVVGTPNTTSSLLALVLLLAFVGPGIWLLISLSMTSAVIAIEKKGPIASLARSFGLVKGRWWPTLGFLLMVGLLGSVAIQLIQLVAIPLTVVGNLGTGVILASAIGIGAQGLIVAGIGAMYTAWYIDLRARHGDLLSEDLLTEDVG